jgi:hypothetical protein
MEKVDASRIAIHFLYGPVRLMQYGRFLTGLCHGHKIVYLHLSESVHRKFPSLQKGLGLTRTVFGSSDLTLRSHSAVLGMSSDSGS